MMYSELRALMSNIKPTIEFDIAYAVKYSTDDKDISDKDFDYVCAYVKRLYDRVDTSYIQLMSDIVCDLSVNNDGYYFKKYGFKLTHQQLVNKDRIDDLEAIYTREYYR